MEFLILQKTSHVISTCWGGGFCCCFFQNPLLWCAFNTRAETVTHLFYVLFPPCSFQSWLKAVNFLFQSLLITPFRLIRLNSSRTSQLFKLIEFSGTGITWPSLLEQHRSCWVCISSAASCHTSLGTLTFCLALQVHTLFSIQPVHVTQRHTPLQSPGLYR